MGESQKLYFPKSTPRPFFENLGTDIHVRVYALVSLDSSSLCHGNTPTQSKIYLEVCNTHGLLSFCRGDDDFLAWESYTIFPYLCNIRVLMQYSYTSTDATCGQQHVGAALDKRKLVEDVGLGTSKSVCEGSGLPVNVRSNPG